MGEGVGVPCAVQKMQDGRSWDTCGWHSLLSSPSQYGTSLRRTGIVCSPHPDMEREETGVVWIFVHFLSVFPGG